LALAMDGHAPDPRDPDVTAEGAAFQARLEVRWDDVDGNRHVRNTAFSDFATHARFRLLAAHGFTQARLEELRFGPVMLREEIRYRREVMWGDELVVTVACAGLSDDGSHWLVHQDVVRADGKAAAELTLEGGWLDLDSRRLIVPPDALAAVIQSLPHTPDYQTLPSLIRRRG
jgi:acyl-CoA thioester hydrolase